ncbi:MAG: hypothetical protein H7210_08815 [Pyrinomonadaceae bacterium]|nr:hypothetical protein [Phycisphaerales bacterium]
MTRGLLYLALKSLRHHLLRSLVLSLCIGVTLILPAVSRVLTRKYQREMTERADNTPLVLGAKGNRFDLVFAALYFRPGNFEPMRLGDYRSFAAQTGKASGVPIPVNTQFTAQGIPVVATTPEYLEQRRARLASGTFPAMIGEVVLGSSAASQLGLREGDRLFSDQIDSFDISRPPPLKMCVVGVLARSGSPDDQAVFVDLKTAWILDGAAHGHGDPVKMIPERLLLSRTKTMVSVSEEMIEYNEVTPALGDAFHIHGDENALPLSAALLFPTNQKAATIAKARVNSSKTLQMVSPREVIDELLSYVFRIRSILDALFVVMAACTVSLVLLITLLSARARSREFETLHRLGCRRSFVVRLFGTEMLVIVAAGTLIAVLGVVVVVACAPELARTI